MINNINEKYFRIIHKNVAGNSNDLSARCDICGDSKTNKNKKRLHLYTKKSYKNDAIHCFNCGYSSSAYNYFKNIHPEIFQQYKNEMGDYLIQGIKNKEFSLNEIKNEKIDKSSGYITLEAFLSNTKKITTEASIYLQKRGILQQAIKYNVRSGLDNTILFGKNINTKNCILFPLMKNDNEVFGYQSRNIKEKKFMTIISPDMEGHKIWNLNNLSKEGTTYIFESIFDALSSGLDNISASLGISNNNIKKDDVCFCFDNQKIDKASADTCKKLAKENKTLFVWPSNLSDFKDFNELLQNNFLNIKEIIENNIYKGLEAYIRL